MKILSLPPVIKHFEAFGVFADKRFKKIDEENYEVISSDNSKIYRVYVKRKNEKEFFVFSNDNGTILKNYIGYPILVVLIDMKILKLADNYEKLKGIKWKELNEKYKNYSKVLEIIKKDIGERDFEFLMKIATENQNTLRNFIFYLKG
ncbi:MAG: hypothetical protein QW197_00305 [Candidatus Aenigmatarchaeota archaeon]